MTFSSTVSAPGTTGLFGHPLFNRHFFMTPAVRHLAWLVHSRPILEIDGSRASGPRRWPAEVDSLILELDRNPAPLLEHLARRNSNRLGLYFEQLYGYALTQILGQRILAQNLPVRFQGRTLGELDFLVHDPAGDQVVHHEIAVKFYMGWNGEGRDRAATTEGLARTPGWYGPDTRDQLSVKLQRLREHQIPMWQSEAGLRCLREEGLAAPDATHLGLYGYLFLHQEGGAPALPEGIRSPDANISWRRVTEHGPVVATETCMAVLRKPHWLGPLQCPAHYKPEPGQHAAIQAEAESRPLLVASLQRTTQGFWLETGRQFVVPEHWCAQA